jgi:hypothetical protein
LTNPVIPEPERATAATNMVTVLKNIWSSSRGRPLEHTALRNLGFTRRRQWSGGAGFRALWYLTR